MFAYNEKLSIYLTLDEHIGFKTKLIAIEGRIDVLLDLLYKLQRTL